MTNKISNFANLSLESKEKSLQYITIQEGEYTSDELISYKEENAFIIGPKQRILPTFSQVFSLYCKLSGNTSYINFLKENDFGEFFIHERLAIFQ